MYKLCRQIYYSWLWLCQTSFYQTFGHVKQFLVVLIFPLKLNLLLESLVYISNQQVYAYLWPTFLRKSMGVIQHFKISVQICKAASLSPHCRLEFQHAHFPRHFFFGFFDEKWCLLALGFISTLRANCVMSTYTMYDCKHQYMRALCWYCIAALQCL